MAKTPLFRQLSSLFRTLRRSRETGIPALELAELERAKRHELRMTRRQLLKGAAAAAAAVPLAGATSACGGSDASDLRVVVVGGGIAGLHCAYLLKDAGINAVIHDAAERVGGRMWTDRQTFENGQHCELGGELIDTGHATMRDLATALDIELLDYDEDDDALDKIVAHFDGGKLAMADILTGFEPIAAEIDAALATLTDQEDLFVYYDNANGGEALDAQSISGWLNSIGASGPVRELLEVAYNIEYGLETDEQNVLNMMILISTDTSELALFGESDERFHAKDGNDLFPTRLAAALSSDQIVLGSALEAVRQREDGVYVLTFNQGGTRVDVEADHVVFALPFSILRTIDLGNLELPAAKRRAIDELGYGTNSKLMVGFSSKPWRTAHNSNGETFTDLGYQATWETSRLQPGDSGIITNFTGGDRGVAAGTGTALTQAASFVTEFNAVFPGVGAAYNNRAVRMHWPEYALTRGSYSAYRVGQYTAFAGAEQPPVDRLHFCGEHTSLDAQGYMEGGALTGAQVADEITAATKRFVRTAIPRKIITRARMGRLHRRLKVARKREGQALPRIRVR
jgi:monoamine oxidase